MIMGAAGSVQETRYKPAQDKVVREAQCKPAQDKHALESVVVKAKPGAMNSPGGSHRSVALALTDEMLLEAAKEGDAAEVARLLGEGANPSAHTDSVGNAALSQAATLGHAACAEELLRGGAQHDHASDKENFTALMGAAYGGHRGCVGEFASLLP